RYRSPRHNMEPAGKWLSRLKKASNWPEATYLAANAFQAIGFLPEGAQRVFFPRLARTLKDVSHLSDLFAPGPGPTREDIVDLVGEDYAGVHTICFVGFDSQASLSSITNSPQGETTFVFAPFYRQDCDVAEVRVEPTTPFHLHYHLNFEDPTINCVDTDNDWKFGRMVNGDCEVLSDFAAEPRYLGSHYGDEIIRIRAHDPSTGNPIPFDVPSFQVVTDEAVRFRYETVGGQWFEWANLGGPTNWGVSVFDAVQVLITNADTDLDCGIDQEAGVPGGCAVDLTPYFVDEFVIGI
ncbi:MAG TPA: hypothetical protein VMO47_03145, partial [Rhodothermales bacterium]|nr:hypothetical protein [Rhodothermales bacterium]